ncbi:MAG: methionyl-tRNA formyltransferase [Bifidobacteriaceae bacterium]|jgi:methionyl-tRNA formyltransferase|nr:methionyl-tRNA formyltransferase [Bifidobacteriaceae bacterium]
MNILFAGTPDAAVPSLEILAKNFNIKCVLTRESAKKGRSGKLIKSPVQIAAERLGIEVITDNPNAAETIEKIKELKIDAAAVVAYGFILKDSILHSTKLGWFNLHFSLLPAFRGAAPVQNAILSGAGKTGVSTFKIDEGMDTGKIAMQKEFELTGRETSGSLLNELSFIGAKLLLETFSNLQTGQIKLYDQIGKVSLAPKLNKELSNINWSESAAAIDSKIRAYNPYPKAKALLQIDEDKTQELFILDSKFYIEKKYPDILASLISDKSNSSENLKTGDILFSKKQLFVKCFAGFLELLQVQIPSRNIVNAASFINGAKLGNHSRFL